MSKRRVNEAKKLGKACSKRIVGGANRRGQEINENFKGGIVAMKKGSGYVI